MAEEFVDLSGLEALVQSQEEGIEIDILNEQAKPIGLKIRVVGPDSDRMQKAVRDVAAEFAIAASTGIRHWPQGILRLQPAVWWCKVCRSEHAQRAEQRNCADDQNHDLSHLLHRRVDRKFLHEIEQNDDE
nr:hypothetical protein [Sinorhizobium meliloti]